MIAQPPSIQAKPGAKATDPDAHHGLRGARTFSQNILQNIPLNASGLFRALLALASRSVFQKKERALVEKKHHSCPCIINKRLLQRAIENAGERSFVSQAYLF